MTTPASVPFLSKSRTRIVPYSNMVSGYTDALAGSTTVIFVGDAQTLLGERSQLPDAGKPPTGVDMRLAIGTRLVVWAVTASPLPAAHEIRVNMANNTITAPSVWLQSSIYPLVSGVPVSFEIELTAPYVRVDLGCFVAGRALWSIALRGPQ